MDTFDKTYQLPFPLPVVYAQWYGQTLSAKIPTRTMPVVGTTTSAASCCISKTKRSAEFDRGSLSCGQA